MNNGVLFVNKQMLWTSFDVVNKVKHRTGLKVGHLGTLDPMATGVLILTIGKATKLFDLMQSKTKTYLAKFSFGYETDTLDATGRIVNTKSVIPTLEQIKNTLPQFIGYISQIPPKYSAKYVNGVRAYDLARNNVEFELKPKKVLINNIKIVSYNNGNLELEIECGSGTYIRSIGRDIAYKLNALATMTDLVRTSMGGVELKDCIDIMPMNTEDILKNIISLNKFLKYPIIEFDKQEKNKILNGQKIIVKKEDGLYKLCDNNECIALVNVEKNLAKMKIFLG